MVDQVEKYFVANGMTEFRFPDAGYENPYSDMDGDNEDGITVEYSNASGRLPVLRRNILNRPALKQKPRLINNSSRSSSRRAPRKKGGFVQGIKSAVQNIGSSGRKKERQSIRDRKLSIKEQEAKTQQQIAASLSAPDNSTAAILQQLNTPTTPAPATGMSKNMKIGLIVGGIAIAAIITIVVVRKMKK